VEVVRDADKREGQEHVLVACIAVLAQDMQHLGGIFVSGNYTPVRPFAQEVEEAVGGVAVMPRKGEERELAVPVEVSFCVVELQGFGIQEQDSISGFEKILGARLSKYHT
jgi:hypothetical protein